MAVRMGPSGQVPHLVLHPSWRVIIGVWVVGFWGWNVGNGMFRVFVGNRDGMLDVGALEGALMFPIGTWTACIG
ncbi:hypothetical protein [Candidatus Hodgkinia cicadicola]|uniref:hypothetical protein n=1 Tax=Candidatus Hodgkinia cicadicola TaxID=573658 RepID=UPI0011BABF0F